MHRGSGLTNVAGHTDMGSPSPARCAPGWAGHRTASGPDPSGEDPLRLRSVTQRHGHGLRVSGCPPPPQNQAAIHAPLGGDFAFEAGSGVAREQDGWPTPSSFAGAAGP